MPLTKKFVEKFGQKLFFDIDEFLKTVRKVEKKHGIYLVVDYDALIDKAVVYHDETGGIIFANKNVHQIQDSLKFTLSKPLNRHKIED